LGKDYAMAGSARTRIAVLLICAFALGASILWAAPQIISATVQPSVVAPGGSFTLECRLDDPQGAVQRITGTIRERSAYTMRFTKQPDGAWTYAGQVPRGTRPGTYHIALALLDKAGRPVQLGPGAQTVIEAVVSAAAGESRVIAPAAPAARAGATKTYMVPMRDGVRLATDVTLGAGAGPWPVILSRTPYGARRKIVAQGMDDYVLVAQDVRGRFDSEGKSLAFFDDGWGEHQDGFDTVKWILAQPWCNGKIATVGGSAGGILEDMMGGANPPGLGAQYIQVAAGSLYHHAAYPGGVLQDKLVNGWLQANHFDADNLALMAAHPFYDALWKQVDSVARIRQERVNIPAVHVGGWFDVFTQGTIDSFVARSQIAPNQWLIMGPWPHGMKRDVGELVFPPNAVKVPTPVMSSKRFFDYWLKGQNNGVDKVPHVTYYVMGAIDEPGAPGNEWRTAEAWPVPAKATEFYLGADHELLRQSPAAGSLKYDYDPARPVPTRGGGNLNLPAGPMDQRPVENRTDVLVFSTPPLEEPVEVTGRVIVRLYASSSARDTTFMAKLCDVYPGSASAAPEMRQSRIQGRAEAAPEMRQSRIQGGAEAAPEMRGSGSEGGRSMLITDGALRAACRESFSDPTPLEPGKVYQFTIAVGSTSIIFNKGHRIRVDISSSNAPRFAVHPNVWGEGNPQVATQTVYYGGAHASAVILPVVTR
jgi:putative CocE/NonD family hydrolase